MNNVVQQIGIFLFGGMIVITLGMMIHVLLHLRTLSASLAKMNALTQQIEKNTALLNIKMEVLEEDRARKAKQNRIAGLIIPLLLAIKAV